MTRAGHRYRVGDRIAILLRVACDWVQVRWDHENRCELLTIWEWTKLNPVRLPS